MSLHSIVSRSNATKGILFRLRTDIILHKYNSGEPIREIALSERYGVSRNAVRNTLLVLEREGLIATQTNGTKVVYCLEPIDIENLYDLRKHIELTAIKQFFSQSNKDINPLLQVINLIAGCSELDVTQILELDAEFHRSVIICSKNKALLQAWETITGVMQSIFHLNMTQSEEYKQWFLKTFQEHHTQLFATLMLTPEESMKKFEDHIADARQISKKALSQVLNGDERK